MDELSQEIVSRMSPVELAMLEAIGVELPPHLARLAGHLPQSEPEARRVRRWVAFNSSWLAGPAAMRADRERRPYQMGHARNRKHCKPALAKRGA